MHQTATEGAFVLEAKLLAPAPKPGWVERPELVYELERAGGARLTVVSAPVGSGKSTLLAQWVTAAAGRDVAWLTLDAGDNSPVIFWLYVVSALRTVRPGFGEQVLRRVQAPGVAVEDDVLPLLADAARELDDVSLVLDDFHTIDDEDVQHGLRYLIERLPAGALGERTLELGRLPRRPSRERPRRRRLRLGRGTRPSASGRAPVPRRDLDPGSLLGSTLRSGHGAQRRRAPPVGARALECLPRDRRREHAVVPLPPGLSRRPRPRARCPRADRGDPLASAGKRVVRG